MLFTRIGDYAGRYRNFAYICSFDRDTRLHGRERLFLSNADPIVAQSDVKRFFEKISAEGKAGDAGSGVPFFVGYDAIPEFYPVGGIRRSGWPMAAAITPEKVLSGTYDRSGHIQERRRVDQAVSDPSMRDKIVSLRDRIISGELLQIVLSRRFDIADIDPSSLLQYFMEGDRSLYVYYYRFGDMEIIGSSPENVVTRQGRDLEIHPIAGTIRRGCNDDEDRVLENELLSNPKELREHRMLVDLARNDLGIVSEAGSVLVVKSMEVQKFASVQHIVSTVHSVLREGLCDYDIVRTVFPAGTVSGAPKVRAIRLIDAYEETARGPYGGGLGVLSEDSMEMALLIRSVYRRGDETYTQAGGGIVMDSDPDREVREYYSKAATVMGGVVSESADNQQL